MTALEQQLKEALEQAQMSNESLLMNLKELESEYTSSIKGIVNNYKEIMKKQQTTHISQLNDITKEQKQHNQRMSESLESLSSQNSRLETQLESLQSDLRNLELKL